MTAPSDNAVWPYLTEFLAKAFKWVEDSPEDQTAMHLYVDKIPVYLDTEVIGHIYTGDETRFEPVQ